MRLTMRTTGVLGALLVLPAALAAQQANASAAAYGMGNNYTATARNNDAVAWNPAALGLSDRKKFTMQIGGVGSGFGFSPIGMSDFKDFEGKQIPRATREQWLTDVRDNGGEEGTGDAGFNWLSMNIGRFGFQASTAAAATMNLNGDAFETVMFGNAGLTGTPRDLVFEGSSMRMAAMTTFAVSSAFALPKRGDAEQALGITGKYVLGHFMLAAQDNGTSITADNIGLKFPIAHTNTDDAGNAGSGFGVDLGYIRRSGKTSIGATLKNVLNTLSWDEAKLVSREGIASFDGNTNSANFDEQDYDLAPAVLKQAVSDYKLAPALAVGIAHEWRADMLLSADVQQQFGDDNSLIIGPKTQVGGGIEYRKFPVLPLRAGVAYVTDGFALSGGAGLRIGSYELGAGVRYRNRSGSGDVGFMLGLVNIW